MAGVKGQKGGGGARPGAGRKPKSTEEELRSLLDKSWPTGEREETIKSLSGAARTGDINAAKVLLSYRFGTPQSGDERRIQENVDAEIKDFFAALEGKLSSDAWAEIEAAIGSPEGGPEPEAGEEAA